MPARDPILEIRGVRKDYRGLRPLRIERLELGRGDRLALVGLDRVMAEVLVNLITGTTIPDAGEVTVLGQSTVAISDPNAWLQVVDRFGLLSERAVLLDQLTAEQNLALPLSLELDDMPDSVRAQVRLLAEEVGLGAVELTRSVSTLSPLDQSRVRLGRALALDPLVLLAEHPTANLPPGDVATLGADISRVTSGRGVASIVMTADVGFAHAVGARVLTFTPATGELASSSRWRRWLS